MLYLLFSHTLMDVYKMGDVERMYHTLGMAWVVLSTISSS